MFNADITYQGEPIIEEEADKYEPRNKVEEIRWPEHTKEKWDKETTYFRDRASRTLRVQQRETVPLEAIAYIIEDL